MKLSKTTISELVKIAVTAIVSVLTTLGVLSCTVNTGNHDIHPNSIADNCASIVEPFE